MAQGRTASPLVYELDLKRIQKWYKPIQEQLRILTYLEANAIFRRSLDEFAIGSLSLLRVLGQMTDDDLGSLESEPDLDINGTKNARELKNTVRQLCELSRETILSCDPNRLNESLLGKIEAFFAEIAKLVPTTKDKDVRQYKKNIDARKLI